jgi:hypothetical protein
LIYLLIVCGSKKASNREFSNFDQSRTFDSKILLQIHLKPQRVVSISKQALALMALSLLVNNQQMNKPDNKLNKQPWKIDALENAR